MISKKRLWTGRILSALPALFLLTSGIHLALFPTPDILEGFAKFGYPASLIAPLGVVEFLCVVLYAIPRTSILGAILLTGFLGGATATHVRLGDPVFIVPVLLAVLFWLGLYLREPRLAALVPLRS